MAELLRMEGVSAGYAGAVVLQDISLSMEEGQTLALLGRNGTGKTTLINTIVGVTQHYKGGVELLGKPLQKLNPYQRAHGRLIVCMRCSRAWPNGKRTWVRSCRVVSSKCWRLAGHWC